MFIYKDHPKSAFPITGGQNRKRVPAAIDISKKDQGSDELNYNQFDKIKGQEERRIKRQSSKG